MKIESPYPKPQKLSDPYHDWLGCEERLSAILKKEKEELVYEDFSTIFYQNLPAADYKEGVYYLETCFNYMSQNKGLEERVYDGVFWWINHFKDELKKDALLDPCIEATWSLFLVLTHEFSILRLSDDQLTENGICESYREIAENTRAIDDYLDSIIMYELFDSVIERIKSHFETTDDAPKSHWFREVEFHTRQWIWLDGEEKERKQDLFDYFHRIERYRRHWEVAVMNDKSGATEGFYQYNQRIAL